MSKPQNTRNNLRKNEVGLVAIVVTVILMIIISLITLGFAKVIRREQRQALDHHLSTRAFYAAESGVNMARKAIADPASIYGDATPDDKLGCGPDATGLLSNYVLDSASATAVTCLLIDQHPLALVYQQLEALKSKAIPIVNDTNNIAQIGFSWQPSTEVTTYSNCAGDITKFYPSGTANWTCQAPVLRVDIVPTPDGIPNMDWIRNNTATYFFYPTRNCSVPACTVPPIYNHTDADSTAQGQVVLAECSASAASTPQRPLDCMAIVNTNLFPWRKYHVRVMPIYGSANVTIYATNGTPTGFLALSGAQAVIDSTAKAVDVLRRIRVSVPVNGGSAPGFALQGAEGLCKRYEVNGIGAASDGTFGLTDVNHPCSIN